jgi:hypothetical protein
MQVAANHGPKAGVPGGQAKDSQQSTLLKRIA